MKNIIFFFSLFLVCTFNTQAQMAVEQGTNVQSASGGYGIFGSTTSFHIAIDLDDVQAKTGPSTFGTLDLNYHGGDVRLNNTALISKFDSKNIGIGTDDPMDKLHIKDGDTRLENSNILMINTDVSPRTASFSLDNLGGFSLGTPDVGLFIDDTAENIGIRTSNPSSSLHIKQASTSSGIRLEFDVDTDHWTTYIDGADDYNFAYNGILKSYILDTDGMYTQNSDRRLKKNISRIGTVLDKVMQLRPSKYYYKDVVRPDRKSYGFIAQEVEEVFPEFVVEKNGYKGIGYSNFAIISIKAIQELKTDLDKKEAQVEDLTTELADIKTELETLKNMVQQLSLSTSPASNSMLAPQQIVQVHAVQLEQNSPNPFKGQTSIAYFVPEHATTAQLQISDKQGRILKTEALTTKGQGAIILDVSTMSVGAYAYSLIVDGQVVATKQMMLTR